MKEFEQLVELKVWGEGKEIEGSYTYEDGYWDWGYDEYGNYYENVFVFSNPINLLSFLTFCKSGNLDMEIPESSCFIKNVVIK